MQSYKDLIVYFGVSLWDVDFQSFIKVSFSDLTEYNPLDGEYLISKRSGVELGFTNPDAVFDEDDSVIFENGQPLFSHFNLYPDTSIAELPFLISFTDNRDQVIDKAGQPLITNQAHISILGRAFFVDSYKIDNLIVAIDYSPEKGNINFLQVRSSILDKHLKV